MSTWIEVNGARVEKDFFDANVCEAKGYDWTEICAAHLAEHVHCMICGAAIDPKSPKTTRAYKSKGSHACAYCFEQFLK